MSPNLFEEMLKVVVVMVLVLGWFLYRLGKWGRGE